MLFLLTGVESAVSLLYTHSTVYDLYHQNVSHPAFMLLVMLQLTGGVLIDQLQHARQHIAVRCCSGCSAQSCFVARMLRSPCMMWCEALCWHAAVQYTCKSMSAHALYLLCSMQVACVCTCGLCNSLLLCFWVCRLPVSGVLSFPPHSYAFRHRSFARSSKLRISGVVYAVVVSTEHSCVCTVECSRVGLCWC
jgi:hypothetical protein